MAPSFLAVFVTGNVCFKGVGICLW